MTSPMPPLLVRVVRLLQSQGIIPGDSTGNIGGKTDAGSSGSCSDGGGGGDGDCRDRGDGGDGHITPWCCTVNVYETGQWIPPHIDNPRFTRPFVTASLLSTQPCFFARCNGWVAARERPEKGSVTGDGVGGRGMRTGHGDGGIDEMMGDRSEADDGGDHVALDARNESNSSVGGERKGNRSNVSEDIRNDEAMTSGVRIELRPGSVLRVSGGHNGLMMRTPQKT